jgi:hypothetical protein
MSYLQLAENGQIQRTAPMTAANSKEFYVFIPFDTSGTTGRWVREDLLDDLDPRSYQSLMDYVEPFQPDGEKRGMLSGKGRDRREARREERKADKAEKRETKEANKTERKAKRSETFGKILDTVGGVAKNIFGTTDVTGGVNFETGERPEFSLKTQTDTRPFYMKPAFIIGSLVVVGGVIYFATRKKGKKK